MNKAERLFSLLTLLRSKRYAVTANQLAEQLQVSERTIYRDIQSLCASGINIEGEAGVGYVLRESGQLPPLMFSEQELIALELGMKMVQAWSDIELATASKSAAAKIKSVLPDRLKNENPAPTILVPCTHKETEFSTFNKPIRQAIDKKEKIELVYHDHAGIQSKRVLQPLGLVFWGKVWTLVAWCELREDYRNFRVDRIDKLETLGQMFETSGNKCLEHYISRYSSK